MQIFLSSPDFLKDFDLLGHEILSQSFCTFNCLFDFGLIHLLFWGLFIQKWQVVFQKGVLLKGVFQSFAKMTFLAHKIVGHLC